MDYHELKRLGGAWTHDTHTGQWAPDTVKKLNADKRPVNLSLMDLPKVNQPGIDAVWEHDGQYTVTEAKASESVAVAYAFGKYKVKKGWIPELQGVGPDHELLHYLLSDSSDKQGVELPVMQMSARWVDDRAKREGLGANVAKALAERNAKAYARRVALVTFEAQGAGDHAQALVDIHRGKSGPDMQAHTEHQVVRVWEASAIDAIEHARNAAHEAKRAAARKAESPEQDAPTKSGRSRRRNP